MDAVTLLRSTELFSGLDDAAAAELASRLVPRSYRRGQPLFHQGDPGDGLFVLVDGAVAITIASAEGDRMVLARLQPPDVLGEIALLDGGPRSAAAEALEPTSVLVLSRTAFLDLMAQPPFVEQLLRSLGGLVRRLSEQASDFVFLDLPGRLAKVLLRLAADGGSPPEVTATQGRLAEMVGGSRQSVNQILQDFAARGLVELRGRQIVLCRPDLLQRRAGLTS